MTSHKKGPRQKPVFAGNGKRVESRGADVHARSLLHNETIDQIRVSAPRLVLLTILINVPVSILVPILVPALVLLLILVRSSLAPEGPSVQTRY